VRAQRINCPKKAACDGCDQDSLCPFDQRCFNASGELRCLTTCLRFSCGGYEGPFRFLNFPRRINGGSIAFFNNERFLFCFKVFIYSYALANLFFFFFCFVILRSFEGLETFVNFFFFFC
jgi:hypothetical protein